MRSSSYATYHCRHLTTFTLTWTFLLLTTLTLTTGSFTFDTSDATRGSVTIDSAHSLTPLDATVLSHFNLSATFHLSRELETYATTRAIILSIHEPVGEARGDDNTVLTSPKVLASQIIPLATVTDRLLNRVTLVFQIPNGATTVVFTIENVPLNNDTNDNNNNNNNNNSRSRIAGDNDNAPNDNPKSTHTRRLYGIPGYLTLLPPVLTLAVAITTQNVFVALFMGVWMGATLLNKFNPLSGALYVIDTVLPQAIADEDHAKVLLFCFMLSGMVAVLSKSGGAAGLAEVVLRHANCSRSGQFATWGLGMCIFFDDYANALIVGNTCRPIAEKLRVSREKIAFLVDATAAPIVSIAPISSWVGFEISLIADQFRLLGITESPYLTYLYTIPFRYYSIFLICFVVLLVAFERDFGPMLACEQRARGKLDKRPAKSTTLPSSSSSLSLSSTSPHPNPNHNPSRASCQDLRLHMAHISLSTPRTARDPPHHSASLSLMRNDEGNDACQESNLPHKNQFNHDPTDNTCHEATAMTAENELFEPLERLKGHYQWSNAIIPIMSVIVCTFFGLLLDGYHVESAKETQVASLALLDLVSAADTFRVLMWSGAISFLVPALLYKQRGLLSMGETATWYMEGMKELLEPMCVLLLAWCLGDVVNNCNLSHYLVASLSSHVSQAALPTIIFGLTSVMSFCVGSSWSVMAITLPIIVPLAYDLGHQDYDYLCQCLGSVLTGSVFGDHVSPLSDTTILVSLATRCGVTSHVKTQIPYALLVAVISIVCGTLPMGYAPASYTLWMAFPIGALSMGVIIRLAGTRVPRYTLADTASQELITNANDGMVRMLDSSGSEVDLEDHSSMFPKVSPTLTGDLYRQYQQTVLDSPSTHPHPHPPHANPHANGKGVSMTRVSSATGNANDVTSRPLVAPRSRTSSYVGP